MSATRLTPPSWVTYPQSVLPGDLHPRLAVTNERKAKQLDIEVRTFELLHEPATLPDLNPIQKCRLCPVLYTSLEFSYASHAQQSARMCDVKVAYVVKLVMGLPSLVEPD